MEYPGDELTEDEKAVLNAVPLEEAGLTADIARRAGTTDMSKVRRLLYKLEDYGEVRRIKKTNPISWQRIPDVN